MQTCEKLTVSVTEAAQMLGLSRPTVYKLIRTDGFPVVRIGTRTLISRAGLERWVEQQAEVRA